MMPKLSPRELELILDLFHSSLSFERWIDNGVASKSKVLETKGCFVQMPRMSRWASSGLSSGFSRKVSVDKNSVS